VILTAHATKVNRTEPNRKRVWPVKVTPLINIDDFVIESVSVCFQCVCINKLLCSIIIAQHKHIQI